MSPAVVDVGERLRSARAIVVGAGALGSPVCLYLASAGGTLIEVRGATTEQRRVPVARREDCTSCGAVPAAAQST